MNSPLRRLGRALVAATAFLHLLAGTAMSREDAAQTSGWNNISAPVFKHLTPQDGLPYPVALALAQDSAGFIWAATPGGVARWDGYRMKVFRHDSEQLNSLPENIVTAAVAGEPGSLWFGSASGIITRFDISTQAFVNFPNPHGNFGRPNGMVVDQKGGIWVAGRRGLFHLNGADGGWNRENALPPGDVAGVLVDSGGRLWAETTRGVMRRDRDQTDFVRIKMPTAMKGDSVSTLFESQDGTVWIGSRRGHVGRIPKGEDKVILVPGLPKTGYRVTSIIETAPDVLWIGQYGGGIWELNTQQGTIRNFLHDPGAQSSLADNSVTDLMIDRSGIIWAAGLRGIDRHIAIDKRITTFVAHSQIGLPGKDLRCAAPAANGNFWLGFRTAGLALLDPISNSLKYRTPGKWPQDLPAGTVQALAETADGALWIGQSTGLRRLAGVGETLKNHPLWAESNIWTLRPDKTDLWVGGNMGLVRIPLSGGEETHFQSSGKDSRTLSDGFVTSIFRDRAQRLWVGTQHGLNLMTDPAAGTFQRIHNHAGDPKSLPSNIVNDIIQDRFGRLWLATANGIGIFDPEQIDPPNFIRLGPQQGLPGGPVLSLIEDDAGVIFAGTGGGLAAIDPESLRIHMLGPAEGVDIDTFWAGSAAKTADGIVIFGGFGGMVEIHPTPLPQWTFQPPLAITEIRAGGRVFNTDQDIVIEPEDPRIQVEFSALDYTAPERNQYAYRLDQGNWISADYLHRTAVYTNLAAGRHKLEMRAANSSGVWNAENSLSFQVLPAWHQTAWFRLVSAGLMGAALIGSVYGRKAYYRRREAELIRKVDAKTAEADMAMQRALAGEEQARRAMIAAEAAGQMKSRFLAVIAHEIRTPLNGLLGMLQVLNPQTPDPEALTVAKRAGELLRNLVESVLEYGRDGAANDDPPTAPVPLHDLIADIIAATAPGAQEKGLLLTAEIHLKAPLPLYLDRVKLSRIVLNLLSNSVKFTDAGRVSLTARASERPSGERRLIIEVSDTGIGIPAAMQDAVFGEFVQADDFITRKHGGVGLGLALSRRMAEKMGGALTLAYSTKTGSNFRLDVPLLPAPPPESAPPPEPAVDADERPPLRTKRALRILAVDDDMINLAVAERMVRHLGHECALSNNAAAAFQLFQDNPFDVVLMDMHMPDMNGLEAASRLRTIHADPTWIVAMTADLTQDNLTRCLAAGMDCGLSKPVQIDSLRKAVIAVLDMDVLTHAVELLGWAEMIRLARTFARIAHRLNHDIVDAAAAEDLEKAAALAHRLRSAAGALGLLRVSARAAQIEIAARRANSEQVALLAPRLAVDRRQALTALGRAARG